MRHESGIEVGGKAWVVIIEEWGTSFECSNQQVARKSAKLGQKLLKTVVQQTAGLLQMLVRCANGQNRRLPPYVSFLIPCAITPHLGLAVTPNMQNESSRLLFAYQGCTRDKLS